MKDKTINILLVEDDEVDVMNVQRAFKKNAITNPLHIAGNGQEALARLRGEGVPRLEPTPAIILLDLNMPRMNGIEFLEALRDDAQLRAISVFVLTTSNHDQDKLAAYNFNVAGYILKPVEQEQFVDAVAALDAYWSINEFV